MLLHVKIQGLKNPNSTHKAWHTGSIQQAELHLANMLIHTVCLWLLSPCEGSSTGKDLETGMSMMPCSAGPMLLADHLSGHCLDALGPYDDAV